MRTGEEQTNVSLFLIFHCSDYRAPHQLPLPIVCCLRSGRHSLILGLALVSVDDDQICRRFCEWLSNQYQPFPAISSHLQPFTAISKYLQPFTVIQAMYSHVLHTLVF